MPRTIDRTEQQSLAQRIKSETAILDLRISKPGFRAKQRPTDYIKPNGDGEQTIDPSMLTINKALLDSSALTEIVHAEDVLKRYLFSRSIKLSILRGGMYAIPLVYFEEVDAAVSAFIDERQVLVDAMVDKYDDHKADAKKRLKEHFDENEYPDKETLRASFGVQVRWMSFDVGSALKSVSKAAQRREQQRAEQEWASAAGEIRDAMREGMLGLVDRMVDRLGTSDDGKPKTFRDNVGAQLDDFLTTLSARNIVGDGDLEKLATKARGLLKGFDPDKMRKDLDDRARVRTGFEQIKTKLDTLLVDRPRRKLARADEEV